MGGVRLPLAPATERPLLDRVSSESLAFDVPEGEESDASELAPNDGITAPFGGGAVSGGYVAPRTCLMVPGSFTGALAFGFSEVRELRADHIDLQGAGVRYVIGKPAWLALACEKLKSARERA